MNKYEKATECIRLTLDFTKYHCDKSLNTLLELVERATPKRIKHLMSKEDRKYGYLLGNCPKCDEMIYLHSYNQKYCEICGQALDWSD